MSLSAVQQLWVSNNCSDLLPVFNDPKKYQQSDVLENMVNGSAGLKAKGHLTPKQIKYARDIALEKGFIAPTGKQLQRCIEICEWIENHRHTIIPTKEIHEQFDATSGGAKYTLTRCLKAMRSLGVIGSYGSRPINWYVEPGWRSTLLGDSPTPPEPTPEMESKSVEDGRLAALQQKQKEMQDKLDELQWSLKLRDETIEAKEQELQHAKDNPHTIVIKKGRKKRTVKNQVHPKFKDVLELCATGKHVLMVGPAGCGKSYLAQQVAEEMELGYGHINCSIGMSEGQLTGRLLPTESTPQNVVDRFDSLIEMGMSESAAAVACNSSGSFRYVEPDFVKCYEQGGVFLMDEIDAADPNVLIILNTALANGRLPVPNRPEAPVAHKHEDFCFIAAANTFGKGADRQYVGRNELDEATLDRFRIGTIEMDYDRELEKELCPDDEMRETLWKYRERIQANRLERIVSTRFLKDAYDMFEAFWERDKCINMLFSGWSDDELRVVKNP